MKKWVKDLLELQSFDLRIKKMKSRLKEIPIEKKRIVDSLDNEKEKTKKAKEILHQTEKAIKDTDSKIDVLKEKIKSIQSKSVMVKKNDEYKALLVEIEGIQDRINEIETVEISLFDDLEKNKQLLTNAEKSFKNAETEAKENIDDLDEMLKRLENETTDSMEKREELVNAVDSHALSIYSRLIKKDGIPLAKIKNNTCGNCHLKLIPQTLNDAKKGIIVICDSCGHLIYFANDE